MEIYNVGLDALADWETADYDWLLVTSGTFDSDQATVADVLVGAAEVTAAGYARAAVTTPVRTVDQAADRVTYGCADPDLGSIAAGETVTGVILTRVVTDDTDSIPVGWQTITPTDTDALDPFVVAIEDGLVAYVDQGA